MIPGEYIVAKEMISCNEGKPVMSITVVNTGDRPVQVGSHFHFFEVNRSMLFDREKAFGLRLNIASGTAVRFEPGEEKTIQLIPIGGNGIIHGFSNLTNGSVSSSEISSRSMDLLTLNKFKNQSNEPED